MAKPSEMCEWKMGAATLSNVIAVLLGRLPRDEACANKTAKTGRPAMPTAHINNTADTADNFSDKNVAIDPHNANIIIDIEKTLSTAAHGEPNPIATVKNNPPAAMPIAAANRPFNPVYCSQYVNGIPAGNVGKPLALKASQIDRILSTVSVRASVESKATSWNGINAIWIGADFGMRSSDMSVASCTQSRGVGVISPSLYK
jgi:hypothetical protein